MSNKHNVPEMARENLNSNYLIFQLMILFSVEDEKDLLDCFGTSIDELLFFRKTNIMPISWIRKLVSNREGLNFVAEYWNSKSGKINKPRNGKRVFIIKEVPKKNKISRGCNMKSKKTSHIDGKEIFLIGLQRCLGGDERCIFIKKAGGERIISTFRESGVIPNEWIDLLSKTEDGKALLEEYKAILESGFPSEERSRKKSLKRECSDRRRRIRRSSLPEEELIPKEKVGAIFDEIKKTLRLKRDCKLSKLLGVSVATFSQMRRGKTRLTIAEVDSVLADTNTTLGDLLQEIENSVSGIKSSADDISNLDDVVAQTNLPVEIRKTVEIALKTVNFLKQEIKTDLWLEAFVGVLVADLSDYQFQLTEKENRLILRRGGEIFFINLANLS